MRAVIQKVKYAKVSIDGKEYSSIKEGLMILLAIEDSDTTEDIDWLVKKILHLRIFYDEKDLMNLSIEDVDGEIMVVSQFTLYASTKKGNRPSYLRSAKPDFALPMYDKFCLILQNAFGKQVKRGKFGAMMQVELINDGPVTIIIDTKLKE